MAAGVADGLQNRFGVPRVSRVGSIPTRSRQFQCALKPQFRFVTLACLVLGVASAAAAQVPDSVAAPRDTVALDPWIQPAGEPAAPPPPADPEGGPPVSAMGAFWRSLVIPGWGQASVDQPTRGAFYFAGQAGIMWMVFKTNSKLQAAKRGMPVDEDLVSSRESQLQDWLVLAGFWALFSGVDAWVSAKMWGFETEVRPPANGGDGVELRTSVPVQFP